MWTRELRIESSSSDRFCLFFVLLYSEWCGVVLFYFIVFSPLMMPWIGGQLLRRPLSWAVSRHSMFVCVLSKVPLEQGLLPNGLFKHLACSGISCLFTSGHFWAVFAGTLRYSCVLSAGCARHLGQGFRCEQHSCPCHHLLHSRSCPSILFVAFLSFDHFDLRWSPCIVWDVAPRLCGW